MRKFSKKIAMMMVLAMLVSMFSGIVSASAAPSVWSAKSVDDDHYAVVMGETIEVKRDEFINFDLFKNIDGEDVEATEAGYEYTWESSDEDVIFIGNKPKKNGYARANKEAEIGAEATISVTFTNLETGKSATRSFDVVVVEELTADVEVEEDEYTIETKIGDVELGEEALYLDTAYTFASKVFDADEKEVEKAEVKFFIDEKEIKFPYNFAGAGEYVITAVATIEKEEYTCDYAVYVVNNNVFEVEQTSMNSFKMTFEEAKDVSKITRENITVYKASKEGATKVKTAVGKATPIKEENAVVVELYSTFAKDNVIFVEYAKETDNFTAIKGDVARIELNDTKVMAGNEFTKLPVKLYDQFGIDITSDELLGKVTIKKISGDYGVDIEGVRIRIWNDKKSAVVKAIYHTYTYTNGVETTFESDEAVISSVTTVDTYAPVNAWALTTKEKNWEITWNNDNRLALGDSGLRLVGKLVKTSTDTGVANNEVNTLEKVKGKNVFSFASSNSAVVIVLADGTVIPVAKGTADIIVTKGDETVGVFTIEVVDARKATTMTVNVKGNTVISALDSVKVELDVRDQYGVKMDVAVKADDTPNKNNAVEIKDLKKDYVISNITRAIGYGDKNEVIFKGSVQGVVDETATYYRSIKVGDAVGYFEYTVQKIEGDSVSYRFDQASIEANTSVSNKSWTTFGAEFAPKKLTIQGYDKNGMLKMIGTPGETATIITTDEAEAVTSSAIEGKFFVTVTKPVWYAGNYSTTPDSNGGVAFEYMTATSGSSIISKATPGNYVFTLYRGVKAADGEYRYDYCSSSTITVKDAQAAYNVTVRNDKTEQKAADVKSATGSAFALKNAIKDVFEIKYNNAEINYSKLYVGDMSKLNTDYVVGNDTVVVIKKINIDTVVNYLDGSYILKETINLPITSVTCK